MLTVLAVGAGLMPSAEAGSGPGATGADRAGMPSVTLKGKPGPLTKPSAPVSADAAGVLSYATGNSPSALYTWERPNGTYVNGLPKPVILQPANSEGLWAVNGRFALERIGTTRTYRIRNYDTGKVVQFDLPAGDTATTVVAANRLLTQRKTAGKWTLRLLEIPAAGGRPVDRPVSGVPDNLPGTITKVRMDARGAAINFGGWSGVQALLDFATRRLTVVPDDDASRLNLLSLSATTVLYEATNDTFKSYLVDRDHPDGPRPLLKVDSNVNLTLLGNWRYTPVAKASSWPSLPRAARPEPCCRRPAATALSQVRTAPSIPWAARARTTGRFGASPSAPTGPRSSACTYRCPGRPRTTWAVSRSTRDNSGSARCTYRATPPALIHIFPAPRCR